MKKQLLILLALFITVIGHSQTVGDLFTIDFIDYQVISVTPNEVKINDYDVNGGSAVNVPAAVTNASITYSVTSIGQTSFFNKGLTSVTLPTTITSIGAGAFLTNNLIDITIPDGVNVINISTFQNNLLSDVTIPNSVSFIGESAFKNNPLVSITSLAIIPPTIFTGGGGDSFNSDRSGIDLTIPAGTAAAYVTDPGALWTGFNSVIENLFFVSNFITYEITSTTNNTVEAVDYDNAGGMVVNIPASVSFNSVSYTVTTIGQEAFRDKQLTGITIPNSVVEIKGLAFFSNQIAGVTIPGSVETIGGNAFELNELTSIIIPNAVTSLGSGSFANNLLTSITIPNSITSLLGTFSNNQLTNVVIPSNIITIGDLTFANNNLMTVTIPNSVTDIGNAAFRNNDLTDIIIPNSVINMGMATFDLNPLATVTSEAIIPPTIVTGANDTFGDRSNIDLFIPGGTYDAYVTDPGALWTDFNSVTDPFLGISDVALSDEVILINSSEILEVLTNGAATLQKYQVFNISGALVKKGINNTIEINDLSSGIYLLELAFDTGSLVKKFAK